jgi:NAD(P)-dependent dehydrogenase (short-subunit alcohol dehydrogenase family)|tara:strand:+ start:462 stop:1175 length:714 start_codon:yes stop_codon:yes gene_type:complete
MNNSESKIAVFGANGAIGYAFIKHYSDSTAYGMSRKKLDINIKGVKNIIIEHYDDENLSKIADNFENYSLDKIIISIGILHNDGIYPEKRIDDFKKDQFNEIMHSNVVIPSLIVKHFHKKMRKDYPSIIAILSARVGSISDNRSGGWYSYRASKAGLNMIIKNLSIELRRTNKKLIVTGLHPGTVDSSLSRPFQKNIESSKLFSPDYSVSKLSSVIDSLSLSDSGKCYSWDGVEIFP